MVSTLWLLVACRQTLTSDVSTPRPGRLWNDTLPQILADNGQVKYEELQTHREALEGFVHWLAEPKRPQKHLKKADRHAFWINAFNALLLFQIVERDLTSVDEVEGWLPLEDSGFYVETDFWVDGQRISLAEIRDERLRLRKYDPRDHAALIDGSPTSPPLRAALYHENSLDQALTEAMRRVINDPRTGVDVLDGVALFPPIFQAFPTDFLRFTTADSLCAYAVEFADPPLREPLEALARTGCPVKFRSRERSLNRARHGLPFSPVPNRPE